MVGGESLGGGARTPTNGRYAEQDLCSTWFKITA